ncbi:MAG: hypothetical protein M3410_04215 [Acidobacteriota bacterium]|nr:hypothetical protein [Acidobacteriota bacterium]
MKNISMQTDSTLKVLNCRANERGAALITMLLVSMLLLAAGGALIVTTAMSASSAIDSTAEMQAFYVAEAGMQSAVNVVRGNVQPLVTAGDRMSLRTAIIPDITNGPGNTGALRFAGWLPYNSRTDPASLVPVTVGAVTGGYRVTVENLDPDSHIVEYNTAGVIEGSDAATPFQRTFGTVGGLDEITIRYVAQPLTTLTPNPNAYPLTLPSNLGSFVIERPATAILPSAIIGPTDFELTVTQTKPWPATIVFEATIEGEVVVDDDDGGDDGDSSSVEVTFRKVSMKADGTTYALNFPAPSDVLSLTYTSSPSTTAVPANVTSPDPKRLLIKSYGFGPRGSEKRLEMMVTRVNLEFEAPAGITLRGSNDCDDPLDLDTGASGAKWYSGDDYSIPGPDPTPPPVRPTFGVTACDVDDANAGIKKPYTVNDPKVGVLSSDGSGGTIEQPSYLDTADKARAYLNGLQAKAVSTNRYFNPGSGDATTVNDSLDSPMFTFVDGDATLTEGAGFLVVTGTLTMRGNTNFKGVILALGEGKIVRNGGGNGDILGGIIIASFDRTGSGGFNAPTFHTNGGGNSNVQYDSVSVNTAVSSSTSVSGVREF